MVSNHHRTYTLNPGFSGIFFGRNLRVKALFYGVAALLCCQGCTLKNETVPVDKSPKNALVRYAQHLEIDSVGDGVIAHIIEPETNDTIRYYLAKNPTKKPKGYIFCKVPLTRIVPLSATQIGMLSKLNAIDYITAIAGKSYIYNPQLKQHIQHGHTTDLGQSNAIPTESIIRIQPQALLFSGFSGTFPRSEQLEKSGTQCIPIFDWKEHHPLGKAEWVKFIGHLIGKEVIAYDYFNGLVNRYNKLTIDNKGTPRPTVFSGNLTGDIWYAPAGESYQAQLFQDAGANYIYSSTKGIGSISLSMEKILSDNLSTEFWMNPGLPQLSTIVSTHAIFRRFKAVRTKHVYCYSHQLNKFWEMAAIEPDKVLSDYRYIFGNRQPQNEKLYFYKKVVD